jgi:hypothetical protein
MAHHVTEHREVSEVQRLDRPVKVGSDAREERREVNVAVEVDLVGIAVLPSEREVFAGLMLRFHSGSFAVRGYVARTSARCRAATKAASEVVVGVGVGWQVVGALVVAPPSDLVVGGSSQFFEVATGSGDGEHEAKAG